MPNVMLIGQCRAISQGLMNKLCERSDLCLLVHTDYPSAIAAVRSNRIEVVVIEVAESGRYDTAYCLTLCRELQATVPGCKLLLMCSEQNEESVGQVIEAKSNRRIDDFVFLDVTMDYLASKIMSL